MSSSHAGTRKMGRIKLPNNALSFEVPAPSFERIVGDSYIGLIR
jgi:hypothetical protein